MLTIRAISVGLSLGLAIGAGISPNGDAIAAPAAEATEKVIDAYVVPRFDKFQKATAELVGDLEVTCGGKPKRLTATRRDFESAVLAWAEIEFLRLGPMTVTGRPERISFWPDPRGIMQRRLSALIAQRDAAALEAGALANKSAAVQGLPALEALLTASAPVTAEDEEARYRCRLAVAIANNLQSLARDLVAEWSGEAGWRARMLAPGPDNVSYKTASEPPAEFARALLTGLQMIQDRQLAPLMPASEPARGKPPRLAFAASGLSGRYVAAQVASLKALYEAMGLGRNVPEQKAWMPRWIAQAWERLAQDAPAAIEKGPAEPGGADRERELRMVRFHLEGVRKLIGRELAPLAGLTIGFNELDGD